MNRICIVFDRTGMTNIVSDEPVRCFSVSDHVPRDRVYEFTPEIGMLQFGRDRVDALLRDGPIRRHCDEPGSDDGGS